MYKGTSHCVANSARLPTGATTDDAHRHGICINQIEQTQRRSQNGHERFSLPKIQASIFAIYSDTAITIRVQANAGHCRLASSHAIVILTFDGIGQDRYSSSLLTLLSSLG